MDLVAILNQTNGRDKVARFLQYWFRALSNKTLIVSDAEHYKLLELLFSNFRKLLRFGRSIESFYVASGFVHQEDVIRRLTGMAKIANGCFLFCDHLIIIGRMKFLNLNVGDWSVSANKYWFLMDLLNLIQNYYELRKLYSLCSKEKKEGSNKNINRNRIMISLYLDILKNLVDILLPLYSLNRIKMKPATSGYLGMISSLLGLLLLLRPFRKPDLSNC